MSKELENLNMLEVWATNGYTACDVKEAKELVKPIEKSLKALEIIKEKILDINYFKVIAANCDLTYQEYNLLMEVLNN